MAKVKQAPSALLETCDDILADFRQTPDGYCPLHPDPYLLSNVQFGAVAALLSLTKRLEQEKAELAQMVLDLQGDVDRSIRYLDPEQ
jgi:hypothetical protein